MRQAVVPFGDADLRIGAEVQLAAQHERDDARDVGAERQPLQVVHQPDVLVEPLGDAHRPFERRQHLGGAALLGRLNPPLDFAHRVDVVGHRRAIARPERAEQPLQLLVHRVENAPLLRGPAPARCAGVPPSPNSRSNTTRGLFSVGSGVVGELHDSVFM